MWTLPYYSVVFSSQLKSLSEENAAYYEELGLKMELLASQLPGYLGVDSVRNASNTGITVSYWKDLESIKNWKLNVEHTMARNERERFYQHFQTRIAKVERHYEFNLD